MSIAMSPTRQQFPLSPKKVIKKTLVGTIGFFFLYVFLAGLLAIMTLSANTGSAGFVSIILFVFLILLSTSVALNYLYQQWYFNVYFYDLGGDYIVIRKGPITPREITIPYERIQDVYVDQDIVDRLFGLYDVHLSSATITSGMEAHIDGVEKPAADGLRAALLKTVSERISKVRGQAVPPYTAQQ